jgi:HEPN superfamily RiboL-PSP-like protein
MNMPGKKRRQKKKSTPKHSALSLFKMNMASVGDSISLYEGIEKLKVGLDTTWLIRGAVVFLVSALDTYFHDRIKYGISKVKADGMPDALLRHRITIGDLEDWEVSRRKGNVIRNWIADYLSTVPLQSPDRIAEYMRYVGVESLWNQVEPDNVKRRKLLEQLNDLIKRRNQIAHEGDRLSGRSTGKKLRSISLPEVQAWVTFVEHLVRTIDSKIA